MVIFYYYYYLLAETNNLFLLLKVLNILTEEVLMYDGSFKSVTDQCDYIKQNLCSDKCELSLVRIMGVFIKFPNKCLTHIYCDSKAIIFILKF